MSQQSPYITESLMNFDTHKSFKTIVAAGFSETQAEAIVDLVRTSKEYDFSKLATKEQVKFFEQKTEDRFSLLDQKIDHVQADLTQKIDHVQADLTQRIDRVQADLTQKIDHFQTDLKTGYESGFAKLEAQMAKQDSQQKAWMMSMLLTILGVGTAIIFKLS